MLYLGALLLVTCVHSSHLPIVKLTFPIILTTDGLLIFDYDWFSVILVSFGQFLLVVVFLYRNAVKRSISLLLVLRLWHLLCTRPRGAAGALNTAFYKCISYGWIRMTPYSSTLVSEYSLNIHFEPIYSNIRLFVRWFESKVVFSVSNVKLVVAILVRCNSYLWIMRLSALELRVRVSVVPGLTNDKLVCLMG